VWVYGIDVADERIRVVAHGRVQGVFFRDSVRREASRRGVVGWARNCADGTAEAVFEGLPEDVAAMVEFVRRGPGHAEVSRVEESPEEPEGLSGFSVR
jgi:acylphosphatase